MLFCSHISPLVTLCSVVIMWVLNPVFQLGFEKDGAVGRWRVLLCVNNIFSFKYIFLVNSGIQS